MGNQQAYMEAAAQIIPVLVLALLADRRNEPRRSPMVLVALLAGVVGEVAALRAVGSGTDNMWNITVSISMGVLGAAILAPHMPSYVNQTVNSIPPIWRYGIARIFEILIIFPALFATTWGFTHPISYVGYAIMLFLLFSATGAIRAHKKWLDDHPHHKKFRVYTEDDIPVADRIDRERKSFKIGITPEMQAQMVKDRQEKLERKEQRRLAREREKNQKKQRPSGGK